MSSWLLALDRRKPAKRPKDLLYIFDTLALFSAGLPALRGAWTRVRERQHPKLLRDLEARRETRFGQVDDLVRAACEMATQAGRPSPPTPDRFVAVCRAGLSAIFDSA